MVTTGLNLAILGFVVLLSWCGRGHALESDRTGHHPLETAVAATALQAHRLCSVLRVIVVVCIRFFLWTPHVFPYARTRTYHAIVCLRLALFFGPTIFYLSVYIAILRGRSHIAPCLASWRPGVQCLKDLSGRRRSERRGAFRFN